MASLRPTNSVGWINTGFSPVGPKSHLKSGQVTSLRGVEYENALGVPCSNILCYGVSTVSGGPTSVTAFLGGARHETGPSAEGAGA